MTERKRKSKVGAPRTEVFAMRFDPKLKYMAEIAARKQRRSLANFVEWAIERTLESVYLSEDGSTVAEASPKLWALDEPDRLVKLATCYPELLTYDEQLIWRVICEHSTYDRESKIICQFKDKNNVNIDVVRDCWEEIQAYAVGTGTREKLNSVLCLHYLPF